MRHPFVHLHCHSPFSFLDGASSVETLVAQAAALEMPALAITDHDTVAALPQLHHWATVYGIKPLSGAEVTMEDGSHLTILAETRMGYRTLCELLTKARAGPDGRRQPKLPWAELWRAGPGLVVLSGCRRGRLVQHLRRREWAWAREWAERLRDAFPGAFYLELQGDAYPGWLSINAKLAELGQTLGIPLVATSDVHYARPEQAAVHDILSCIRLRCDVHTPHPERPLNAARWLHGVEEAEQRWGAWPQALENTARIAERCEVVLDLGRPQFPAFELPPGVTDAAAYLRELTFAGARERYGRLTPALTARLEHELAVIEALGYADYFLMVWDIVQFARRRGIRCAGRGSAADSAVAYCLYLTDVDAAGRGLLFERFMSLERAEMPDIDIDFDHRRRDEVMAYVYRRYGERHVARIATYQTFRGRSAVREVGAALGLPDALLDGLAKRIPWSAHADGLEELLDRVPELRVYASYRDRLRLLWKIAADIAGFPRHLGMHVGGVVVSRRPLFEITCLQPSAKGDWMTPFDKEDVERVGCVKLDLLSLRTLGAMEDAVRLAERAGRRLDLDRIPAEDPETYRMLGRGESVGVFQLESPAQRVLQSRLKPDKLEDLVASVALIRPGPVQGNMVEPFLARRRGEQPVTYLHPKLAPILEKTYGVVLFQEQVIEIATAIANFTPGEADRLRRVMSRVRSLREMDEIGREFLRKAEEAGVAPDVAQAVFACIRAYAGYGFCEAHAAAFASTAYKTAYLVRHHPAEFFAAILNQYPMGYYPVHVLCAEARRRGVEVRRLDVTCSEWDCTVENGAIRLGFRLLKGMREPVARAIERERARVPFSSLHDLLQRVPEVDALTAERLVRSGAADALHPHARRALLWSLPVWLADRQRGGITAADGPRLTAGLPALAEAADAPSPWTDADLPLNVKLADEYALLGVGLSGHLLSLWRPALAQAGCRTLREALRAADGERVRVAGIAVRPHRPPTRSGRTVVFVTLEDETALLDAVVFEQVYRASGAVLFTPSGRWVVMDGVIDRRAGDYPQLRVERVWSWTQFCRFHGVRVS
ncbi:MAG: DNA polymerase III subunit alpha [Thermoflavifilum sp.]|nr:DNA polymerase III subunit alpha [Thermoflavifilum sp.]MCL6513648.1 DNA polymerase III subunit alpha [Alicyclobacillus sp.]